MQYGSKSIALTILVPKRGRSGGPYAVTCFLGRDESINDLEVDLLDIVLRTQAEEPAYAPIASNDNPQRRDVSATDDCSLSSIEENAAW